MPEMDAADEGLIDGRASHKDIVAVHGKVLARDAAAAGGIALWIGVDEQRALLSHGERGGQVYGRGGLADSTFLIGDSEDASQKSSARRVRGDR